MSITINTDSVMDLAKLLFAHVQERAQVRAINRLANECRRVSQDTMTSEYTFKGEDAKVYLEPAKIGRLQAMLKASGKRLSFMYFNAVQTATGVVAQIQTGKKTSRKRAFIAQPSGRDYRRSGQSKSLTGPVMALQRKSNNPYPLRRLTGPAPGTILKSKKNMEKINDMIRWRGEQLFKEEIDNLLRSGR